MRTMHLMMSGTLALSVLSISLDTQAAIALDRTRVIFEGGNSSVSLNVSNENKQLPYLVQGWVENSAGEKINDPLTIVPPVQRLEPGAKSQIKIQGLAGIAQLPQDRESLFYFNIREIPPRSDKPNTLQIALQTRIKLFYRPEKITLSREDYANPWQQKITLTKEGGRYRVNNPTAYFVTIADGGVNATHNVKDFKPLMVAPFSSDFLSSAVSTLGDSPVLTYINDFGGHPQLVFTCKGITCTAKEFKK